MEVAEVRVAYLNLMFLVCEWLVDVERVIRRRMMVNTELLFGTLEATVVEVEVLSMSLASIDTKMIPRLSFYV